MARLLDMGHGPLTALAVAGMVRVLVITGTVYGVLWALDAFGVLAVLLGAVDHG